MSVWAGRRVLVTGAAGFIGSHLTERLVELGARTRVLLRYTSSASRGWLAQSAALNQLEIFSGDISDRDVLARATQDVEVVFHLAALIGIPYSYEAPSSYVRTNIEGTAAVLHAARAAGVRRVVHTSTSEVYGTAVRVPMTEDHPLQPQSPYAASKASADLLAFSFHRSFGLDVATLRPFNTYGPRQSNRAVIPTIVTQALSRSTIELGHLSPTRDFTHVLDTVEGFIRVGEAEGVAGETFNLGSGREISVSDLAARIQRILGTARPIAVHPSRERPAASEVDRLCADATKIQSRLGWSPQFALDDGLQQTIDWIKAHRDRYRAEVYGV
jgi:dTDP-glucose 4,6-dehydratase